MITSRIIKARRALREAKTVDAENRPALEEELYQLRRAIELADQELMHAWEAAGHCGICEKPKTECEGHVLIAPPQGYVYLSAESPKDATVLFQESGTTFTPSDHPHPNPRRA